MSQAVQRALDAYLSDKAPQPFDQIQFSQIWVGMAGYDRPLLAARVEAALLSLFKKSSAGGLRVTSDIDLLPMSLIGQAQKGLRNVLVLVVGTGSITMSFSRKDDGSFVRTNRAGG